MQTDILTTLQNKAAADRLLTMQEVCDLLQVSVSTLYRMRRSGAGPDWVRVRGAVRYRRSAIQSFLNENEVTAS